MRKQFIGIRLPTVSSCAIKTFMLSLPLMLLLALLVFLVCFIGIVGGNLGMVVVSSQVCLCKHRLRSLTQKINKTLYKL